MNAIVLSNTRNTSRSEIKLNNALLNIEVNEDKQKLTSEKSDFFNQLQEKEKRHGDKARGGGHSWTTFVEILLGDW